MRKLAMAGLIAGAATLPSLGATTPSHAAEGPWCHSFGGAQGGIENCSIQSLEMCRFEIQGNGGSCSPNPHWHGNLPVRRIAQPAGLYPWPWR
jgi:uncharacterized protein DUF3551